MLYVTRLIKPTQKLAFAVVAGMGGLLLLYFFVFILSIFNWDWLYSDSFRTVGVVVTLSRSCSPRSAWCSTSARSRLASSVGAPKDLEWYLAFGLMVTLVWLYISILKLLALLSRNR